MPKGDKQSLVGQFFEHVAHRIKGGELSRNENGDICLWRTGTVIEVKGSGEQSSYGFRLDIKQIEHYEAISLFPFERAWYMFFAYRNRRMAKDEKTKKRPTELSHLVTPLAVNRYLAETVSWCVLIDLSIVSRWKETCSISTKSLVGHRGTPTIDLKCQYVREFANGGLIEGLKSLDLDPMAFGTISGAVKTTIVPDLFSKYTIRFPLTAVLPVAEIASVQRRLRRRGIQSQANRPMTVVTLHLAAVLLLMVKNITENIFEKAFL